MVKLRARCILVGDAAVGKSALCQMLRSDGAHFQKNYSMLCYGVTSLSPLASLSIVLATLASEIQRSWLTRLCLGNSLCSSGKALPYILEALRGDLIAFGHGNFTETAGVEIVMKSLNIPETGDSVELYIFDSAGRETFVEACEKTWGQPSLVCVVFDISSLASFHSCSRWLERVRARCSGLPVPDPVYKGVLVGNKSDLSSRREVEAAEAQDWAQSQGLQYYETSAKDMENCDAPFLSLAQTFYILYQDRKQMIQNLG